jgi:hypothetical protein
MLADFFCILLNDCDTDRGGIDTSEVNGRHIQYPIGLLMALEDIMKVFVHFLEDGWLKVLFPTLSTHSRWYVLKNEQASFAAIIVVDPPFFHFAATE